VILEDFVMLGTTVPEPSLRSHRVFVCSAGFSPTVGGLLRIYPLARMQVPHRWGIYRVPLERNPHDGRAESYMLAADRSPAMHERINESFTWCRDAARGGRAALLAETYLPSIRYANAQRLSLAMIRPRATPTLSFRESPDAAWLDPSWAFDQAGSKRFPHRPYLSFADEDGAHNLGLHDWGAYELMRKNLWRPYWYQRELPKALHLGPTSHLLVGNMCHQRNVWLVISVLNLG